MASVATIPQLADYLVNGFWSWQGTVAHHWPSNTITYNLGDLNAQEQTDALAAMALWSSVADITFVQTNTSPNISFNHDGSGAATYANWGSSGNMTSATVSISSSWYAGGFGSYMFQTYVHEIGHALGLGHQGPYNGSATYGKDNIFTDDTWQFSIMSYFSQNSYGGAGYAFVVTPEMADIYAIQSIYGAATTRTGNTTYGFNSNAGSIYDFSTYSKPVAMTIYDSGGNDTLDASGYSANQTIDLTPGNWSSIGGSKNDVGIWTGTTIENAIGGSGNDTITGNAANNTINGGAGTDTAVFHGLQSQYQIAAFGGDTFHVADLRTGSPDGTDTVVNVENLQFADGTYALREIEAQGATALIGLGNNYLLDPIGGSGPTLKYSGTAVVSGQFGTLTPIGAEAITGGYEVVWKDSGTGLYTVWTTDSTGNYVSTLLSAVAGSNAGLQTLETTFQQDLNGDGTIGNGSGGAGTVIESAGSTDLTQVGSNYALYGHGTTTGPTLKNGGVAVVAGDALTPIGAEAITGGYEVVWKDSGTGLYTVWTTDSTGNYVSTLLSAVAGSNAGLQALETTFQQDLNGDGVTGINQLIESAGNTDLTQVGSNYALYGHGTTTGPTLKNGGVAVVAGGTLTPIGAEAITGGYEVVWKDSGTGLYTVWTTDSTGNYVSTLLSAVAGSNAGLQTLETSFHQDLNGDGVTGINQLIESAGNTDLTQVGSNYALYGHGTTTGPTLKNGGVAVVAGGALTPIGAEAITGGYEVVWKDSGTGLYTVWTTDSTGNYVSTLLSAVAGSNAGLQALETTFQQDLNGDGVTGINQLIESAGNTDLAQVGSNYALYGHGTTTGPTLKNGGVAVVAGGALTPIGAEAITGGYEVVWKDSGTGLYTVWTTDSTGNYVSTLLSAVAGSNAGLQALETTFQQDLNGDGVTGINQLIESAGNTDLTQVGSNYALYGHGTTTGPTLKNGGVAVVAGDALTPIGAEAITGGYEVVWKDSGTGLYTVWTTDSTGNYVSTLLSAVAGSNAGLQALETTFQQDLNGDGVTGINQLIESAGNTDLTQVGSNYALYGHGTTTGPTLKNGGVAVVAGGTLTPIGAEAITGGYEVVWKDSGTGLYTVWTTDSTGNYVSTLLSAVAGSNAGLQTLETSFHQDLNGDGVTGINQLIESAGNTDLTQVGSNYALYGHGTTTGPTLKNGGVAVVAGGALTPIGAEAITGGYEVVWKDSGTGLYTVWTTDSTGNYVSTLLSAVAGSNAGLQTLETSFHQDLNGDGVTGINQLIESAGSTDLTQVGSNYALYGHGTTTGPTLKNGGVAVVAGGALTPIGAEAITGGYEVVWKDSGTGLYTVWTTDSTGNYVSTLLSAVAGSNAGLQALETTFQQDLNGDGVTGINQLIELAGNTDLTQVGSNYALYGHGTTTGPTLKNGGVAVVAGGTLTPIGAEAITGGYEVVWKDSGTGLYTVWTTDSTGNYVSTLLSAVAGSNAGLQALETTFQQDLNGDGVTGINQLIESAGNTDLTQVGSNYALYGHGTTTGPTLKNGGVAVVAGDALTPIGAEAITGGYEVVWKDSGTGLYTVWTTDSTGNYVSTLLSAVAGSNDGLQALETTFQQDLNGDGVTGITYAGLAPSNTMPSSYSAAGDFNGDGIDDMAWRNTSTGYVAAWLMDGSTQRTLVHPSNATSDWEALAPGDYNGDGIDDIAWRNTSTGYVSVWLMDSNGNRHAVHSGDAGSAWEALAPGDFNGDGIDDIAWRNTSTGYVSVWLMDSNGHRHVVHSGDATSAWQALAPGDYNGDGIDDIAWRNSSTGYVSVWLMDSNGHRHVVHPSDATSDWQALAPGDYNGDGITDIAWRNTATGYVSVWLMDSNGHRHAVHSGDASSDWQALGSGDYNGDGIDDMAWRNTATGYVSVWLMDKNGHRHFVHSGDATADWQALSPGDYNGDGITDIAWRNTATGYVSVWQMDSNAHRHVVHPSDAPNIWQAV